MMVLMNGEFRMDQKLTTAYLFVVLWIAIGILLTCLFVYQIYVYTEAMELPMQMSSSYDAMMAFMYTNNIIFALILVILAVIIAIGTFTQKKWAWIGGLMLSTYVLITYGHSAVYFIGLLLINNSYGGLFENMYYSIYFVSTVILPFLSACTIYLAFRSEIKAFFQKNKKTDSIYFN